MIKWKIQNKYINPSDASCMQIFRLERRRNSDGFQVRFNVRIPFSAQNTPRLSSQCSYHRLSRLPSQIESYIPPRNGSHVSPRFISSANRALIAIFARYSGNLPKHHRDFLPISSSLRRQRKSCYTTGILHFFVVSRGKG